MSGCSHKTLILLKERSDKLRCRTCHLVLTVDELTGGFCPECYEVRGEKRKDFEKLVIVDDRIAKYRCEECGATIEWEGPDELPDERDKTSGEQS